MTEHDPKSYEAARSKINTLYAALTLSNEANRRLEAKVKELTTALKQIADNEYIIGWKGAAYIANQALKQEGE